MLRVSIVVPKERHGKDVAYYAFVFRVNMAFLVFVECAADLAQVDLQVFLDRRDLLAFRDREVQAVNQEHRA